MPIYEYQCESCTDRFEVRQSMKDDALTACPRCGKHVQRLISSPAIMFKGSGWYVTDYSDKMKPSSDSDAPASAPATGEKKEATPNTSDQTTSPAPSTPASPPSSAPASTPSSTTSSTSNTTTTAPASSSTK